MIVAVLFSLVVSVVVSSLAVQVPLSFGHHGQDQSSAILPVSDADLIEWNLDKLPNPNDTDHLVFETVHSLLQHWPNTRMRNGHNIVPGVIPKGTLLYHGRWDKKLPPGPEWAAIDPEHSHLFCVDRWASGRSRDFQPQTCWHLTLATTRPLNVIYFDGSSAAKLTNGTIDTQDLVAWGKFGTGYQNEENQRIQDLCKWGKDFGIDGFVRMEMDFEVMICNFTSGLRIVSFLELVSRGALRPVMPAFVNFEVIQAGSWHNHFPGETRVQLDLSGLVSLYDVQLAPSLVSIRASQERWDHLVRYISNEDILAVKSRLEAVLTRPSGLSSGIDWNTLIHVIVDRYSRRLELTRHRLNSSATEPDKMIDLANKTQTQLRTMLTPYILFRAVPTDPSDATNLDWTVPVYRLCATTHTYAVEFALDSMTDSEILLLRAVRGTSREICRVITKMWAAGVYAGLDQSLNTKPSPDVAEVTQVWSTWREDLNRLMAWLDWNVWIKCNPACGVEEMCYLPTWPLGFPRKGRAPGEKPTLRDPLGSFDSQVVDSDSPTDKDEEIIMPDSDEWIRPQPKCVRRLAPHAF